MPLRPTRPRALKLLPKRKPALGLEPQGGRVLGAAARDVARELGKQAAKEHFKMLIARNGRAS